MLTNIEKNIKNSLNLYKIESSTNNYFSKLVKLLIRVREGDDYFNPLVYAKSKDDKYEIIIAKNNNTNLYMIAKFSNNRKTMSLFELETNDLKKELKKIITLDSNKGISYNKLWESKTLTIKLEF